VNIKTHLSTGEYLACGIRPDLSGRVKLPPNLWGLAAPGERCCNCEKTAIGHATLKRIGAMPRT
jgi:hypothetical protein